MAYIRNLNNCIMIIVDLINCSLRIRFNSLLFIFAMCFLYSCDTDMKYHLCGTEKKFWYISEGNRRPCFIYCFNVNNSFTIYEEDPYTGIKEYISDDMYVKRWNMVNDSLLQFDHVTYSVVKHSNDEFILKHRDDIDTMRVANSTMLYKCEKVGALGYKNGRILIGSNYRIWQKGKTRAGMTQDFYYFDNAGKWYEFTMDKEKGIQLSVSFTRPPTHKWRMENKKLIRIGEFLYTIIEIDNNHVVLRDFYEDDIRLSIDTLYAVAEESIPPKFRNYFNKLQSEDK